MTISCPVVPDFSVVLSLSVIRTTSWSQTNSLGESSGNDVTRCKLAIGGLVKDAKWQGSLPIDKTRQNAGVRPIIPVMAGVGAFSVQPNVIRSIDDRHFSKGCGRPKLRLDAIRSSGLVPTASIAVCQLPYVATCRDLATVLQANGFQSIVVLPRRARAAASCVIHTWHDRALLWASVAGERYTGLSPSALLGVGIESRNVSIAENGGLLSAGYVHQKSSLGEKNPGPCYVSRKRITPSSG